MLLLHRGHLLREAMRRECVTEEEIHAAVRNEGITALDEVESIVFEMDDTFSVVWRRVQGV